jgi:hypothetical protein
MCISTTGRAADTVVHFLAPQVEVRLSTLAQKLLYIILIPSDVQKNLINTLVLCSVKPVFLIKHLKRKRGKKNPANNKACTQ